MGGTGSAPVHSGESAAPRQCGACRPPVPCFLCSRAQHCLMPHAERLSRAPHRPCPAVWLGPEGPARVPGTGSNEQPHVCIEGAPALCGREARPAGVAHAAVRTRLHAGESTSLPDHPRPRHPMAGKGSLIEAFMSQGRQGAPSAYSCPFAGPCHGGPQIPARLPAQAPGEGPAPGNRAGVGALQQLHGGVGTVHGAARALRALVQEWRALMLDTMDVFLFGFLQVCYLPECKPLDPPNQRRASPNTARRQQCKQPLPVASAAYSQYVRASSELALGDSDFAAVYEAIVQSQP